MLQLDIEIIHLLKKIEPDPERYYLVKKGLKLFLSGRYTLDSFKEEMKILGLTTRPSRIKDRIGQPLSKNSIHWMLKNPFYYGYFEWGGKLYSNQGINNDQPPTYPPMISKAEYDEIQEILSGRRNNWASERGRNYVFKGLIRCEVCGRSLLGEAKTIKLKSGEKREVIYYHCTQGDYFVKENGAEVWKGYVDRKNLVIKQDIVYEDFEYDSPEEVRLVEKISSRKGEKVIKKKCEGMPWFKAEDIEKEILNQLELIHPDEKAMNEMIKNIGENIQEMRDANQNQLRYLRKRLTEITAMIDKLWEKSLMPETKISDKDFHERLEKFIDEKENIKEQIRELEDADDASIDEVMEIIELSKSFKKKYLASDMITRNRMLKLIYRTILARKPIPNLPYEKPLDFIYNEPFETLFIKGLLKKDEEVQKERYSKKLNFEKWYPWPDSNRRHRDYEST